MSYWNNKVVVVTGASAGFGLVLAKTFAQQGSHVVLAARNPENVDRARSAVEQAGGPEAIGVPTDVTRDEEVRYLADQTMQRHGRVDALVNCAGRSSRGALAETSVDEFRQLLELNFLALARCTQTFLPHLLPNQGHVINVGSLAAKSASRFLGAYPASKFPVAAYSQQLRLELGKQGLHVLLVCPGPIRRDDAGSRYAAHDVPDEAKQPGGGVKLKGIDPQWLATRVLDAGAKRKPELIVPMKARLLFAIAQLSPALGDWILAKMTKS